MCEGLLECVRYIGFECSGAGVGDLQLEGCLLQGRGGISWSSGFGGHFF